MGTIAAYVLLDDDTYERLTAEPGADADVAVDYGYDDGEYDGEDLDKLWDLLHVALTGTTSSDPIEGDPLSEAILGVREIDPDSGAEFVAVVSRDDVVRILTALRRVDIADVVRRLNPSAQVRQATYPEGIWEMSGIPGMIAESFALLLALYERAAAAGRHVGVSFE